MKNKIFLIIVLISISLGAVAQKKNQVSIHHSISLQGIATASRAMGVRYYRTLYRGISLGVGGEYMVAYGTRTYSFKKYDDVVQYDDCDFYDNIKAYYVDVLLKAQLLKPQNRFNVALMLGATQQFYNFSHIPTIDVFDNVILNQKRITVNPKLLTPKIGVEGVFNITKNLSTGLSFYTRPAKASFPYKNESIFRTAGGGIGRSSYNLGFSTHYGIDLSVHYRF
jgi:hypothetical protein